MNATEPEERAYLEEIKEKLDLALRRGDAAVRQQAAELRQKKEYLHEHQSGLDEADLVAAGQSIDRMAVTGGLAAGRKRQLVKLLQSPYFGRIDFQPQGKGTPWPVYIGLHPFTDEARRQGLIYDWRAPIASLFYDFELGDAAFTTPTGTTQGVIGRKRQYKIRDGRMEFMLENGVNILDDVLQRELAQSSDDRLKTIVATVQRDQNAIIRNEDAAVMVIQGVAGSGKTSIALHRIAFLLYRHRETLAARDVLIISPNKVFADYIANVLPELGEEHIPELVMDELAADLLEHRYPFQTFFEQVDALLERPDPAFAARIRFKSSVEFLSQLNQYLVHVENHYFTVRELRVGSTVVPAPFLLARLRAYHRLPLLRRLAPVAEDVRAHVRSATGRKLSGAEKAAIGEGVARLFRFGQVLDLYRDFYRWLGLPELLQLDPQRPRLEYADVFPLLYLRLRLEGLPAYAHVRHLLVDEMQDYTPVHYAVLARVFSCRKTILGDARQAVNPYSASSAETIARVFPQAELVRLHRSYRSTVEITDFTQRIVPNPDLRPLARHGPAPVVAGFASPAEELRAVQQLVADFQSAGGHSLGIICKTQRQAAQLHQALAVPGAQLLTADSTTFKEGVIVATAHLAKGLEFDEVIVPFASAPTYHSEIDKGLLYVACTRAMHRLTLTHTGAATAFVAA